ncbi:hypothetical protein [Massilia sp. PWRC2]|uniref:hypothetical protein n=1 Tax=Massilia sp. PWRC2 TaxID=2804626 RepID=UPI003CEC66B7
MKLRGEKKQDALLDGQFKLCGVAAAIVGSAIVGGVVASSSTSKAVGAQTDASNRADSLTREQMATQQRLAEQARMDATPYREAGYSALNKLAAAPDFTGASVGSDPGYQFGLDEGMKGLTNSAAARGNLLSGAALKASTRYAQDYAGTKFNDAFNRDATNKNRLASLAGIGQVATANSGANTMQLGGQLGQASQSMAQSALGVGNARASGYIGNGNALVGALNQGVSAWKTYNGGEQTDYNALRNGASSYSSPSEYSYEPTAIQQNTGALQNMDWWK